MFRGQQIVVWIRDLEKLGWGTVEPGKPGQVKFKGKNATLTFTKGEGVALINSLPVKLPINTYMHETKLMVPLSFVAKALGYEYDFGYKPVAVISSSSLRVAPVASNTISGKVLYDDKGVKGIIVRAVDGDFNPIDGAVTKTEADGSYKIGDLPDGSYMAYVYVNDNPSYFNRVSEAASVSSGTVAQLKSIVLGKIISPQTPEPGDSVSLKDGRIEFTWNSCEGASNYTLTIYDTNKTIIASTTSPQPNSAICAVKFKPEVSYVAEVKAFNAKGQFLGGTAGAGGKPWTFEVKL